MGTLANTGQPMNAIGLRLDRGMRDRTAVVRRRAIRRRRMAEMALLTVAFCMAWFALAAPAILVTR